MIFSTVLVIVLTLYHASTVRLKGCISIVFFSFEYFDSFEYYAACYVPLTSYNMFSGSTLSCVGELRSTT